MINKKTTSENRRILQIAVPSIISNITVPLLGLIDVTIVGHLGSCLLYTSYGMTKHADCNKLFKKLTGKEMRSFKDLNVAYKPEDGKKRFPGVVVRCV